MEKQPESLTSFTDNTITLSNQSEGENNCVRFKTRRIIVFAFICLADILVFFQRAFPTVITKELSDAYGCEVDELGIFSSMFYYPYAILQLFGGLLSDVMEPAVLIGFGTILASFGSIICGVSRSLLGGCVGRFIVGIGCGPVYTPCNRIMMNWFPLKQYPTVLGIFLFFASCGGLLAQTPLTLFAELIGWKNCIYSISAFATIFAMIFLFCVRGSPISFGYSPVNQNLSENVGDLKVKEKMIKLFGNFKTIIKSPSFWIVGTAVCMSNGSYFNITGIWGGPYLQEVFHYSKVKTSNALLGLSIGACVGSLMMPAIAKILKSKKWTVAVFSFMGTIICIPFTFFPHKLNFIAVLILLGLFAICSTGAAALIYPMCTEYFPATAGASATGCLNCLAFATLIVLMPLTGSILDHYSIPNSKLHYPNGFKYGLWLLNLCGMGICTIALSFAKDPGDTAYGMNEPLVDYKLVD